MHETPRQTAQDGADQREQHEAQFEDERSRFADAAGNRAPLEDGEGAPPLRGQQQPYAQSRHQTGDEAAGKVSSMQISAHGSRSLPPAAAAAGRLAPP